MHRRATHWSSTFRLQSLRGISADDMHAEFLKNSPSLKRPKRSNSTLAKLLIGMTVGSFPVDPDTQKAVEVTNLLDAFILVLEGKEVDMYNNNTCIEFHRLLVVTISSYMNALEALRAADTAVGLCKDALQKSGKGKGRDRNEKMYGKGEEHVRNPSPPAGSQVSSQDLEDLMDKRVACAERVWKCWFLLWRIVSSGILSCHLEFLSMASWLPFPLAPIGSESCINIDYTEENETHAKSTDMYLKDRDELLMFTKWYSEQVSYLSALDAISSKEYYDGLEKDHGIVFKFIAAKSCNCKMDKWEDTLRSLAKSPPPTLSSFSAQAVINLLKQKIDEYTSDPKRDNILKAFTPKQNTPTLYDPIFYGTLHCETILISLTK